jgi:hypothetical protein
MAGAEFCWAGAEAGDPERVARLDLDSAAPIQKTCRKSICDLLFIDISAWRCQMKHSSVLPIAWITLRILIVLNWISCVAILALLAFTFINEPWTIRALGLSSSPDAQTVLMGMRAIAALGVVALALNFPIFKRLLAMVVTVRVGDPFVAANAYRLHTIAWLLLALQLIGLVIAGIGKAISTSAHPIDIDAGFSVNGWLAVILTFVLARVFAEGTLMREDLEGTV